MALTRIPVRARALALVPMGTLVVHELRYLIAFGSHADRELARQGHAYLVWAGLAAVRRVEPEAQRLVDRAVHELP